MKNVQSIFVSPIFIFLLSCGNRENTVDKTETFDSEIVIDSTITDTIDSSNVANPGNGKVNRPREAWLKLLNDFSGKPAGSGDREFKAFLELQEKELTEVNERHKASPINESLATAIFKKLKLSPRQQLFVDSVRANGLAIDFGEGMSYVVRDWSFFLNYNISFLSPNVRNFLKQMAKDQNEGFAKDASLTITPVQLADRAVWWKNFRDENPAFILKEMEREHTHKFILALTEGTDNTPLLTGTGKLFDFYVKVKGHLANNYPHSPLTRLLVPYYAELETSPTSAKRKIRENLKYF